MKILQITNKVPFPPKDGGTVAVLNIGEGLARQEHEVHLFAINTSKHYVKKQQLEQSLNSYKTIRTAYLDTRVSTKEAVKNLFLSSRPYNYQRFYCSSVAGALRKFLKDEHFDIILLEGLYLTPYLNEIRQNSRATVVYRAHNIEHEIWGRAAIRENNVFTRLYYYIIARRLKKIEQGLINQYDALLPITHRDSRVFQEMGNNKPVQVVPAGICTGKFDGYNTDKNQSDVFYIGALDWFPNQEGLTWFVKHVWPGFYSKYPDTNFYVGGRNGPPWLNRILNKSGIKYYGEVRDAIDFMIRRKIMVVPLFSGSGMRVKIIEGMAAGRAIITTSIGAEGIPATHRQELFIADDVAAFQESLELLVNDKALRQKIGNQAKEFVRRNFDNTIISKNLHHFLNYHKR